MPTAPNIAPKIATKKMTAQMGERREAGQQEHEATLHLVRAHGHDCADHGNTKEYEPEAENPKSDESNCDADPACR